MPSYPERHVRPNKASVATQIDSRDIAPMSTILGFICRSRNSNCALRPSFRSLQSVRAQLHAERFSDSESRLPTLFRGICIDVYIHVGIHSVSFDRTVLIEDILIWIHFIDNECNSLTSWRRFSRTPLMIGRALGLMKGSESIVDLRQLLYRSLNRPLHSCGRRQRDPSPLSRA